MFIHFDKNRFRVFFAVLVAFLASAAWSAQEAPIKPLYFEKVGSSPSEDSLKHLEFWQDLMKYKIFGAHGIEFMGGNILVTDSSGWFGTTYGDFEMKNTRHVVGGPILIGGNVYLGNGKDSLTSGPVRITGNVESNYDEWSESETLGAQCIGGLITTAKEKIAPAYRSANKDGGVYVGADYDKCPSTGDSAVPMMNPDLYIPAFAYDAGYVESHRMQSFSLDNEIHTIDIPESVNGAEDIYDIFIDEIRMANASVLLFRMPYGGRLTRVFVKDALAMDGHPKIRIAYMDSTAQWDATGNRWMDNAYYFRNEGSSAGALWIAENSTPVANSDYAGDLLFYITNDFSVPAITAQDSILGTFISTKTITVKQHMTLAGQLLADVVKIDSDFDGSGYRYVPFHTPKLPKVDANITFPESDTAKIVPIKLDKVTKVNVHFNYCFKVTADSEADADGKTIDHSATLSDFNNLEHVCGVDTGHVTIYANSQEPAAGSEIKVNAKIDKFMEVYSVAKCPVAGYSNSACPIEILTLRIFDLQGAVMENNTRDGSIELNILDRNIRPTTKDTVLVAIEDSVFTFGSSDFSYSSITGVAFDGVLIHTLPKKGTLTYKGVAVVANQVIPVDSLSQLTYVAAKNEYGLAYTSFGFAVVDANGTASSRDTTFNAVSLNVTPVNDAPVAGSATYTVSGHKVVGGTNLDGSIPVTDVDDTSFTYAFDSTDANFKLVDSMFVIDANTGVISVKKDITLKRSTNDSLYVIGVVVSDKSASTGNDDDILSSVANVNIVIDYGYDPPSVDIVNGTNSQGSWDDPVIIKTNVPDIVLSCNYDGSKDRVECLNTTLVDGCHVYSVKYENPDKDGVAYDSVEICLSTAAPVVTVGAKDNKVTADNIYTVVEDSDAKDPNYYVNSVKNPITVTVLDTVAKVSKTYSVDLELDTVGVSKSTLSAMEAIVDANIGLDQDRAFVVRTPVNGKTILVSYKESYNGKDSVTVSYVTDNNGDIVKEAVLNDKGKIDSIAVYTITYTATVNGKTINISYKADASTGAMLLVDANGNLMTEGAADDKFAKAVPYTVSYDYVDKNGNSVNVTYAVDKSGDFVTDESGNVGYKVSYTYVNEYGNSASSSVYIVLDQIPPKVEITYPHGGDVIHANFVEVAWEVNGVVQDTLTLQSLEKGYNPIVRFYKDKAGNVAVDTVWVIMKDAKDIAVSIEQPVTVVTKEKMDEYYSSNPPKDGETFAISIRNPSTGKEVETLIGGDFKNEKGSGEAPYANVDDGSHLGPTLVMDIKVPVVSAVGGLATLDDLIGSDGLVSVDGVDAANSKKISVQEYVSEYCEEDVGFANASDVNLYDIKMDVKIWIYTTLGNFVDYVHFNQSLNDPSYANDAGLLQMFFELKPDKNGDVRDVTGRLYATGSYVYKVEVGMKNTLRCTLPPVEDISGKKRGDVIKTNDNLLKPFGYKRPKW